MNYNDEKEHDRQLIALVEGLDSANRLDILKEAFRVEGKLGKLENAQHRKLFDVELRFSNLSLIVETKVHSDEGGRWMGKWQTEGIVEKTQELDPETKKEFRFITYGTAEFYTKPYFEGAATPEFKHIGLDAMIAFVERADESLPSCKGRQEWLRLMRVEREKRRQATELLREFAKFRASYLSISGENDFPNGRLVFCAPELAFVVLSRLARQWRESEYSKRFGKLSLYPVGRIGLPHDSVLNFAEMWEHSKTTRGEKSLYLEINEDFNLNLKCLKKIEDNELRDKVWKKLEDAQLGRFAKLGRRNYRQGSYVLYEMDFGLLEKLDTMEQVVDDLASLVEAITQALPNYISPL